MNTQPVEYSISQKEINRRKKASLVLVIFLVVGFLAGAILTLRGEF